MSQSCAICGVTGDGEFVQPKNIGINAINKASNERGDTINLKIGDYVHKNCRKEYIHKWYISQTATTNNSKENRRMRSTSDTFDFKYNCLFCSSQITERAKQLK